jgi:hypothetical protein
MKKTVISRKRGTTALSANVKKSASEKKALNVIVRGTKLSGRFNYFLNGAGSVFDVSGSQLSYPKFGSLVQDQRIIENDFSSISEDFRQVLDANFSCLEV